MDDGTVHEADGKHVLRFEREIEHPIGVVWESIATPDGIRGWLGATELDLALGASVRLQFDKTVGNVVRGRITEVDPPRVLEYTFGEEDPPSMLRWELSEQTPGATRLVLTHTLPSAEHIGAGLAGWHTLLDMIPAAIAGEDPQWSQERWDEVRAGYEQP
ncbi:MAG: hypothetical protein QOF65_936 [Thermoleophilaceae bacterium]|nr:hypothetical protein [Thermoleophilaceae bacterium]